CLLPQRVHEVVRLNRRGLVVLDAETDVYVMTAAEFAERTGDDNAEDNARAAEIAARSIEDRVFAALITDYMDASKPTSGAMGQAGLILLTAACEGVGPEDDGSDEASAAYTYRAAYEEGFSAGIDAAIAQIKKRKTQPC